MLAAILSAVFSLIAINVMDKDAYAILSLSLSFMTIGALVCNPGITQGFVTIGAKIGDSMRGDLYRAALMVMLFALPIAASAIAILVLFYLRGSHSGAALFSYFGVILLLTVTRSVFTLRTALYSLEQRTKTFAAHILFDSGTRIVLLPVIFLAPYPTTALLVYFVAAMSAIFFLKRAPLARSGNARSALRSRLLRFSAPLMPGVMLFNFIGQAPILMLAVFSNNNEVANYGALLRIAQMVALGSIAITFLFQPILSKEQSLTEFGKLSALLLVGMGLGLTALNSLVALFPQYFLLLLGAGYEYLIAEVRGIVISASLGLLGVAFYTINISRFDTKLQILSHAPSAILVAVFFFYGEPKSALNAVHLGIYISMLFVTYQLLLLSCCLLREFALNSKASA